MDGSRRRRGCRVDIPRRRDAAGDAATRETRRRAGIGEATLFGRAVAATPRRRGALAVSLSLVWRGSSAAEAALAVSLSLVWRGSSAAEAFAFEHSRFRRLALAGRRAPPTAPRPVRGQQPPRGAAMRPERVDVRCAAAEPRLRAKRLSDAAATAPRPVRRQRPPPPRCEATRRAACGRGERSRDGLKAASRPPQTTRSVADSGPVGSLVRSGTAAVRLG